MGDHSGYTVRPVVNLSHAPTLVLRGLHSTNLAQLCESAWEQNYSHKFLKFREQNVSQPQTAYCMMAFVLKEDPEATSTTHAIFQLM